MDKLQKKTKGDIAELSVAKKLLENGWQILIPYGENHRYDLVAEKKHKFVRIQVKYTTPKNGVLNINCRSSNNWSVLHYDSTEIDIIAAYNPINNDIYFIPISEINHSLFKIRISPTKNNQKLKIHLAKDFKELKV
jgi:Holliday junction resolvase